MRKLSLVFCLFFLSATAYGNEMKIEKVPTSHESVLEQWEVVTENPDIYGVSVAKQDMPEFAWNIYVVAAEFIRDEPLESKFRKEIESALLGVEGVKKVEEADREVWVVDGNPNGGKIVQAVLDVLIKLDGDISAYLEEY